MRVLIAILWLPQFCRKIFLMNLTKIEKIIFYTLIFFLPSQLAYHFWPSYAFVFGVRVDYLAPTIYLTDLLLIFLLAISRTKIKTFYLFLILLFFLVNIFVSASAWVSFWKCLKILELTFFAKYIYDNFNLITEKMFSKVLSLSFIVISILGILQFINGGTLGGIFYLMGERTFGLDTPGIALQTINGLNHLRVYSSFSHPNSLAGFLLIGIIYFISVKKKDSLSKLTLVLSFICFLLTFSLSAFIASGITLIFYFIYGQSKKTYKKSLMMFVTLLAICSFILPSISSKDSFPSEVGERLQLAGLAKNLISKNLFLGTGFNTFTLFNRDLQPVHNIFLLMTEEAGLVGLIVFLILINKSLKSKVSLLILPVLVIGFFDHYFLTLQQNLLTLAILFGASLRTSKELQSGNVK